MLTSLAGYNNDCKIVTGSTLHHDDSLNDRTVGGLLDRSYQSTKKLWFQEFGENFIVEGGMYRGEPPNDYFSIEWKGDDLYPLVEGAREMGASSTSPNTVTPPSKWATLYGNTSDGSPAFVAPSKPGERKDLIGEEHMKNYVLGKVNHKVGYFHVETKEAYEIMLARLQSRMRRAKSQLAMEKSCCGPRNFTVIKQKEMELRNLKKVYSELSNRSKATKPSEKIAKDPNGPVNPAYYDTATNNWLYPPVMWDSCGGACGGGVACSANVGGVAACGGRFCASNLLSMAKF